MSGRGRSNVRPSNGVAHSHPDLRPAFDALAQPVPCPPRSILYRQGEPSRGLYLLTRGQAKLTLTDDRGTSVTVRTVGPGYVLGLPAIIGGRAHLFTAEILEPSEVAFIEGAQALEFLRQRPDLCFDVVQMLGDELLQLPPAINHRSKRKRHRDNS